MAAPKDNKYAEGNSGGRPKFEIDYEQVKKLAVLQCTQEEIAHFLGCSVDTLQRDDEFCGIYKNGMAVGRMSLRRKQWKAAEDGNTTMLVWLGKQYLGQSDKSEVTGAISLDPLKATKKQLESKPDLASQLKDTLTD